jgi:hypothetical protein
MLKIVGNTVIQEKHKATCHCGAVELELDQWHSRCTSLRLFYVQATWRYRCFCSLIWNPDSRRNFWLYQFNTFTAKHYFCANCGIYTHHQRRSNPEQYGYNVGCLEGVNPFDLRDVPTNDGVNHPADRQRAASEK